MKNQVNLVLLTDRPYYWDIKIPSLPVPAEEMTEINPDIFDYSGVILDIDNPITRKELLIRLRKHTKFCLQPIFLTASIDTLHDSVADGIVEDFNKAHALAQPILNRIASLDYDVETALKSQLFRVILFSYTRDQPVRPVKGWNSPSGYHYPQVELLTDLAENACNWLQKQSNRLLLEQGSLVDRLRRCPYCSLVNPNYIDVCPNCRSIQIQQYQFLHCFTCGTVKPEVDFQTAPGILTCPHCSQQLRHIGTDYDRPLENYSCKACQSSFTDPFITTVCLRCDRITEPEDLEVINHTSYRLTEQSIIAAKTGRLENPSAVLDSLQNVTYQHFVFQFNWLFSIVKRYENEEFTLVAIRSTNFNELEQNLGHARLTELLEEYVHRVESSVRTPDLISRRTQNELWILLPNTGITQRKTVINRIAEFSEETQQRQGDAWLKLNIAAITIPTESRENDNPEKLLMLLKHEIEID
jgi:GGDEF domain-containing protein